MLWRSILFNIYYSLGSILIAFVGLPVLLGPRKWVCDYDRMWSRMMLFGLRHICKITYEVRGQQHMTSLPVIYAVKHQSAWDIIFLLYLLHHPVFVMKRQLLRIPFVGWHMARMGMISIERSKGTSALKKMIGAAKEALFQRRAIIIFPEGTRTRPGQDSEYHPGVGALYHQLKVPVVPVALDSGTLWPRGAFIKKPGVITIEFLPAIAPGLPTRDLMPVLKHQIENACANLLAEKSAL